MRLTYNCDAVYSRTDDFAEQVLVLQCCTFDRIKGCGVPTMHITTHGRDCQAAWLTFLKNAYDIAQNLSPYSTKESIESVCVRILVRDHTDL